MKEKIRSFFLPVLLAVGFAAELYLFPEILAPDCIQIAKKETENRAEEFETGDSDYTVTGAETVFRFYESPYRIAWKFF